jgi:V8-like Glu-specific endopeptidase
MDEYGQQYEGDFVEDFEALIGDLAGEADYETGGGRRRYGDLNLESYEEEVDQEYDQEVDQEFDQEYDQEVDQESEVIGPDTRRRVFRTSKAPFRYVCNLEYDVPGIGRRSICSGSLIGPRTVLTAGHCLEDMDPKRMRVIPGRNGTLEPLAATAATGFVIFPGYSGATATDVGIIHLADPIGNAVGYWTAAYKKNKGDNIGTSIISGGLPVAAGKLKVNLSGYPADMPSLRKYGCRDPKAPANRCRHSGLGDKKRSTLCGTHQHRAYNLTVRLSGRILHYLNDTCPGHSGSPVWVKRHPSKGGRVLVGVHIAGDNPSEPGVANRAVFIDSAVRKFIVDNTK